ncbi:MAG: bifunctional 4-hydroxy-2-oxoglutarate aldolase/2-dehydro-3-deoxy-phosphogluconate aldolase [Bacillota bacterium]
MKDVKLNMIKESGIVAIIRGIAREKILKTTEALLRGGIHCIEVTFNTCLANEMIEDIRKEFAGDVLVGAGTIMNEKAAQSAYASGAEFILSPSLHKDVIEFCKNHEMISIPGAFTPTEIVTAKEWGADIIKIFPAGAVNPQYIKLLSGPLDHMDMMAVGGIDLDNVADYMENGCVCVGVGSSLVNIKHIEKGEYSSITDLAKTFTAKIKEVRR